MKLIRSAVILMIGSATVWPAAGPKKPDFTGTWELTTVERDGQRFSAGATFKETQIWVHREPNFRIKMMDAPQGAHYFSLELEFVTDGKKRLVGYKTMQDGKQQPVYGSAHWEADHLVYEQEQPNATKNSQFRIIRSLSLKNNGEEIVGRQSYWMVGSDKKREATWHWQKKHDLP